MNVNGVKVGYMRVSTADGSQKLDMQETALRNAGVSPEKIYSDMASGAKEDRTGLNYMLKSLNPGDTVVVWKLDRLGRSVKHLVNVIDTLIKKDVHLEILAGACHGINMSTQEGKMFFHLMATFAQFDVDTAYHLIQAGVPKKEIARRFNVTVQTIFNYFTPEGEIKQRG